MLKTNQEKLNANLEFVSAGIINAKRYRLNDTKKYRTFIIPKNTTNLIYGGIFLVRAYEEEKYKLHAWYNNSIPFTNQTMKEDLFDCQTLIITPLKKLKPICNVNIDALCFVGNQHNDIILHSVAKPYWRIKGSDTDSFNKMINEN